MGTIFKSDSPTDSPLKQIFVGFVYPSVSSTRVSPVQSRGSARSYTNFYFILLIKLNAVFRTGQLNYCTGVSRATEMLPWDSTSAKRLKTTGLSYKASFYLCVRVSAYFKSTETTGCTNMKLCTIVHNCGVAVRKGLVTSG